MAIIDNGILGGFRGKIGPVVGVSNGGTFYMRSRPSKKREPGAGELSNRAKFKIAIDHLHPLKGLVKAGFKNYYTKTGGYRAALSYNRKHAIVVDGTTFHIAPELFRFSGGSLSMAVDPSVSLANDVLEISWNISGSDGTGHSDQLMVLVYDRTSAEAATRIYDGAFRGEGLDKVSIPTKMRGGGADIYIAFVAADRSGQSHSQYLGRFVL